MYIDIVPNRNSPPAILLRESYREGKRVLKRTVANLSQWPTSIVEGLRILLRGGTAVERFEDSFDIERSLPHGHVAAVLSTLRKLKLDTLIAPEPSEERNRVVAMIVARILDPRSKLATARGLDEETSTSTLAELLEVKRPMPRPSTWRWTGWGSAKPRSRRNWPNGIWKTVRWCSTT